MNILEKKKKKKKWLIQFIEKNFKLLPLETKTFLNLYVSISNDIISTKSFMSLILIP